MPMIISSLDEVMRAEKRDMLFMQFGFQWGGEPGVEEFRAKVDASIARHREWFAAHDLRIQRCGPPENSGFIEGGPVYYAVYASRLDDPKIVQYSAEFEDAEGKSLDAKVYQMVIVQYDAEKYAARPPVNWDDA